LRHLVYLKSADASKRLRCLQALAVSADVRKVTGQLRCATLELCNFDTKQSNLCCFDGFCTNVCCANADGKLTGPREQNRGLWAGYKLKTNKYEKYDTKNAENDSGAPGEWNV